MPDIIVLILLVVYGFVTGWMMSLAWPKYYYKDQKTFHFPSDYDMERMFKVLPKEKSVELHNLVCTIRKSNLAYWKKIKAMGRFDSGNPAIVVNVGNILAGCYLVWSDKILFVVFLAMVAIGFGLMRKKARMSQKLVLPDYMPHIVCETEEEALESLQKIQEYNRVTLDVLDETERKITELLDQAEIGLAGSVIMQSILLWVLIFTLQR